MSFTLPHTYRLCWNILGDDAMHTAARGHSAIWGAWRQAVSLPADVAYRGGLAVDGMPPRTSVAILTNHWVRVREGGSVNCTRWQDALPIPCHR